MAAIKFKSCCSQQGCHFKSVDIWETHIVSVRFLKEYYLSLN